MTLARYALIAMTGLALSACAASSVDTPPVAEAQGERDVSKFEVFFDLDRSEISETAAKLLFDVAGDLKRRPDSALKLSVHSVAAGWDAHSQALSERRAAAIKAELARDGVSEARIGRVDIGHAELTPMEDGVREPQNRRTEITIF